MDRVQIALPVRSFGETSRRDVWWVQPLVGFLGFSAFIAYSTWAAFQGEHYHSGPYLSPFFARAVRRLASQSIRRATDEVAGVAPVFTSLSHSVGPGRIPLYLILLSGGVLQGLLGRPAVMWRR